MGCCGQQRAALRAKPKRSRAGVPSQTNATARMAGFIQNLRVAHADRPRLVTSR